MSKAIAKHLLLAPLLYGVVGAAAEPLRVEAEDLERSGDILLLADAEAYEYSGTGFVRFGEAAESALAWQVEDIARGGLYQLRARAATLFGTKGYVLEVNGAANAGYFRGTGGFDVRSLGLVELREGSNTIRLLRGWGHYDVDWLELIPAEPFARPRPVPETLCDPAAGPEARALFARLRTEYGRGTISGIYRAFGQGDWREADQVAARTGRRPVIYGVDLMPFSPAWIKHEAPPDALLEDALAAGRAGHPLLLMWHWNVAAPEGVPYYKGFNTHSGGFDPKRALEPGSPEHTRVLADLDAIAAILARFQAAGLPVLWRPLHEAEGGWFWWSTGGPETFRGLWRLMHTRFTEHHGLHNLIWVYSAADLLDLAWYPGDDVTDIVSADLYPDDPADNFTQSWELLFKEFNGRKLIALGEVRGVPDFARLERIGVRWSFFLSWPESFGPAAMEDAPLRERYHAPAIITWEQWRLR